MFGQGFLSVFGGYQLGILVPFLDEGAVLIEDGDDFLIESLINVGTKFNGFVYFIIIHSLNMRFHRFCLD